MGFAKGLSAVAALLLSTGMPAHAQDDLAATFTFPVDEGLTFYDNIDVIIRYECDTDVVDLRIYCNNADTEEIDEVTLVEDVECSEEQYKMRIGFSYESDSCWFNMRDTESSGEIEVNSVEFALSADGPAETTFGLEEPTTSFAETTTAPTTTEPPTTTETEAEPTETDPSGSGDELSTGAKAGIGVGVSLGVLGIASLAAAFWLVRRKRNGGGDEGAPAERQELYSGSASEPKHTYHIHMAHAPASDRGPPSELMDTRHNQHELPA